MICYVDDKWATPKKIGSFWAILNEVHHPQSWRGHMRSFWEIPFFMEQATCALSFFVFFQISLVKLCTTATLSQGKKKKKKSTPKLGIICERYWLLNLAPRFEQHMDLAPKTSNTNLTKNLTCLEYENFFTDRCFAPKGPASPRWGRVFLCSQFIWRWLGWPSVSKIIYIIFWPTL